MALGLLRKSESAFSADALQAAAQGDFYAVATFERSPVSAQDFARFAAVGMIIVRNRLSGDVRSHVTCNRVVYHSNFGDNYVANEGSVIGDEHVFRYPGFSALFARSQSMKLTFQSNDGEGRDTDWLRGDVGWSANIPGMLSMTMHGHGDEQRRAVADMYQNLDELASAGAPNEFAMSYGRDALIPVLRRQDV